VILKPCYTQKIINTEPNELLNLTQNTQPLMLIAGIATYRAYLQKNGLQANIHAGHSLGEYTALVASNALSFADALPLVKYSTKLSISTAFTPRWAATGMHSLEIADMRVQMLPLDGIRASAIDEYAMMRDAWSQGRNQEIKEGAQPQEELTGS
jgi:malonyl CoA-acyl carrier protein transacylase